MKIDMKEPLWVERYRPQSVNDCLLPAALKARWQGFVKDRLIPNMTLVGPPGTGKTTVAVAACNDLDSSYLFVNAAKDAKIEMVRERITDFCMTRSLVGGRKYVILDEVENLNDFTQGALRGCIEAFSSNAGFILTCNDISGVTEPILSRCPPMVFKRWKMTEEVADRLMFILDNEKVTFDPASVAAFLRKHWPDLRRIINGLQHYSAGGRKIDAGILEQGDDLSAAIDVLFVRMKNRDFQGVRSWVTQNVPRGTMEAIQSIYKRVLESPWTEDSRNAAIIELGNLSNTWNQSVDQEISLAACLTIIMQKAEWQS